MTAKAFNSERRRAGKVFLLSSASKSPAQIPSSRESCLSGKTMGEASAVSLSMGRGQGWFQTAENRLSAPAQWTLGGPNWQRDFTVFHVPQRARLFKIKEL